MATTAPAPSRRDRLRAATTQEIIQTARRLLVEQGAEAVSLRAIAFVPPRRRRSSRLPAGCWCSRARRRSRCAPSPGRWA